MRLILMRHADSDWTSPAGGDRDRPLNPQGNAAATALGRWMQENAFHPDLCLCSSARRTRETLARLGIDVATHFEDTLYLADAATLAEAAETETVKTLLVIAHNPGIAEFAHQLVSPPPNHTRFDDFPPGATAVIDHVGQDTHEPAKLHTFVVPNDFKSRQAS